MASVPVPPLPLSQVGRAAHDIGLAGLLGGNLFGRLALHPAVIEISDEAERGKLVNAAWRRYGTVNTLSLLAVASGWAGARAREASDGQLSDAERRLARAGGGAGGPGPRPRGAPDGQLSAAERGLAGAKDVLVAAVAASGLITAVEGTRFARRAPGGAVPLRDGDHASASASASARRAKRRLNALGAASLGAEAALVAVNAALNQQGFRRPPARRLIPRLGRL